MIINLPKFEETMESGYILEYHVAEGDFVKIGDGLFEVETDKFVNMVVSPAEGKVKRLLVEEGDEVNVGEPILELFVENEYVEEHPVDGKTSSPEIGHNIEVQEERYLHDLSQNISNQSERTGSLIIPAVPAARLLANREGINLEEIRSTGPGGAILLKDVEEKLGYIKEDSIKNELLGSVHSPYGHGVIGIEIDMTQLLIIKDLISESFEIEMGDQLPLTSFFVKGIDYLSSKHQIFKNQNPSKCSIKVQLGKLCQHLVINQTEQKNVYEIAKEIYKSERSGDGSPKFTISSVGNKRIKHYFPGLHQGESVQLGLGAIINQVSALEDRTIEIRPYMYVSLAYNSSEVLEEGVLSFLDELKYLMEHPSKLITWR